MSDQTDGRSKKKKKKSKKKTGSKQEKEDLATAGAAAAAADVEETLNQSEEVDSAAAGAAAVAAAAAAASGSHSEDTASVEQNKGSDDDSAKKPTLEALADEVVDPGKGTLLAEASQTPGGLAGTQDEDLATLEEEVHESTTAEVVSPENVTIDVESKQEEEKPVEEEVQEPLVPAQPENAQVNGGGDKDSGTSSFASAVEDIEAIPSNEPKEEEKEETAESAPRLIDIATPPKSKEEVKEDNSRQEVAEKTESKDTKEADDVPSVKQTDHKQLPPVKEVERKSASAKDGDSFASGHSRPERTASAPQQTSNDDEAAGEGTPLLAGQSKEHPAEEQCCSCVIL